jgi:hypothetical protein
VWREEPGQVDVRRFMAGGRQRVAELTAAYAELCGSAGSAVAGDGTAAWSDDLEEPE